MICDIEMKYPPAPDSHNDQHIQNSEIGRFSCEEITG
jgi:hypothetical protein